MEIKLTKEEAEKYFYNALCNGLGYIQNGYGLELKYYQNDYIEARRSVQKKMDGGKIEKEEICYEDVLMEILRIGKKLKLVDRESGEKTRVVFLKDVHERVAQTPIDHLNDMIQENDDAITADVILQTVFYEDVIFG